ncbi:flippase [Halocalculus aciditolerans]|uniref:flippase n=1 Tax=Halocalculus aciditolerans TaxID=1383812 RepID=UPI00166569F0|nr:flippase [Halocalculus aciditolerans]
MVRLPPVLRNVSSLFTSNLISKAFDFWFFTLVVWYLGPDDFGSFAAALSLASVFSILVSLGADEVVTREVARSSSLTARYTTSLLSIRFFAGVIMVPLVVVSSLLLGYSSVVLICSALFAVSLVFRYLTRSFHSTFNGHDLMWITALSEVLRASIKLGGGWFLMQSSGGIFMLSSIYILSNLISLAFSFALYCHVFDNTHLSISFIGIRTILSATIPFALSGGLVTLYNNIDVLMLSKLIGTSSVGMYSAPYKIMMGLVSVMSPLVLSVYPMMSRKSDEVELSFLFGRLIKYVSIISIPMGFGVVCISPNLISLLFGPQYDRSSIILRILIWNFVLISLSWPFAYLLKALDAQSANLRASAIELTSNVILNAILIVHVGVLGAAIATVITAAIGLAYTSYAAKCLGYFISNTILVSILKSIVCSFAMALVVLHSPGGLFVHVTVGIFTYTVLCLLMRVLDEEDIRLLREFSPIST